MSDELLRVYDFPTGDDPVLCHLCGKDSSLAMIFHHLVTEHGFDAEELAEAIVTAPVVDRTGDE